MLAGAPGTEGTPRAFTMRMLSKRTRLCVLAVVAPIAASMAVIAWPSRASQGGPCRRPRIEVVKAEATLELRCDGALRAKMPATFGANPVGPKQREGDERTPEGQYHVTHKVADPRFHRFLGISYPNEQDLARARKLGIRSPGRGIGIHGTQARLAPLARAWTRFASHSGLAAVWGPTDGCVGVTNEGAELLYKLVPVGTPVNIAPRRRAP